MRRLLVLVALLTVACTSASSGPSPAPGAPSPTTASGPTIAPTPSPSPDPAAAPTIPNPRVALLPGTFPIAATLELRAAPLPESPDMARLGVQQYLEALDRYRDSGFDASQLGLEKGPFRDAVVAGLRSSATPGVRRKLEIERLEVLRRYTKPWGTQALVDVSVTIVDRDVAGVAAAQRESGVLRLTGDDRLYVRDAWDGTRWLNGNPLTADAIRQAVVDPLGFYLRLESWVPGSAAEQWRTGDEATPFTTWRAQRLAAIDRTQVVSRTFDGVTARIERYDTFAEISSGLATVRLAGTLVTADAAGRVTRTPFERRVRVFLFGNWMPEVVDEEVAGEWISGGQLALEKVDINRA